VSRSPSNKKDTLKQNVKINSIGNLPDLEGTYNLNLAEFEK
jgi:hypothetical protein